MACMVPPETVLLPHGPGKQGSQEKLMSPLASRHCRKSQRLTWKLPVHCGIFSFHAAASNSTDTETGHDTTCFLPIFPRPHQPLSWAQFSQTQLCLPGRAWLQSEHEAMFPELLQEAEGSGKACPGGRIYDSGWWPGNDRLKEFGFQPCLCLELAMTLSQGRHRF